MKSVYWNPSRRSLSNVVVVALVSLAGVVLVDHSSGLPGGREAPRVAAARRAAQCFLVIRQSRLERGHPIDRRIDPAQTGLIGAHLSPITSVSGHLESKQTSVNPNFAAAIVQMLQDAGVEEGDCIAIGWSGSFPALNACVCAAVEELQLRPVVISSASASQYGGNFPDYLWIDMERDLFEAGLISFRSVAASRGGYEDCAAGLSAEGRQILEDAIRRNGLALIDCATTDESLAERMRLYREHAAGRPIRAYVNVGGGTVSVGRSVGKKLYTPGLNLSATPQALQIDSVMTRFARQGTPLIHLVSITDLARDLGLPIAPRTTPVVGQGGVYPVAASQRGMAAAFLAVIVVLLLYGRRAARDARQQPRTIARETAVTSDHPSAHSRAA